MNKLKRTLIIGAGIATIGVAGLAGVATTSALTSSDSSTGTSLIDKLVAKFHLNKDDVQAVFDADRTEHQEARKADQAAALKTALKDGKITQTQYDYIVKAQGEVDTLLQSSGSVKDQSDTTKAAIKAKFDELRTWFSAQDINPEDIGIKIGGHRGPGDHNRKN